MFDAGNFSDDFFKNNLKNWLQTATVQPDFSHVKAFDKALIPADEFAKGTAFAKAFRYSFYLEYYQD